MVCNSLRLAAEQALKAKRRVEGWLNNAFLAACTAIAVWVEIRAF